MVLLNGLVIYIILGVLISIFAEFKMKDDSTWDNDSRLLIFVFWPLVLYAYTL